MKDFKIKPKFRYCVYYKDGSSISSPIYEKDKAKVFDYCKKEFAKDIEKGFKPKYYTILKYSARPVGSLYKTTEIYKSEIMNY